jgi:hypothetical protein
MIRITPPLPVVAKGLAGFLVEMSATHARIDWMGDHADSNINKISVSRSSAMHSDFDVRPEGQSIYRFDEKRLGCAITPKASCKSWRSH